MIVLRDVERGPTRVQVLECDCDRPDCRLCFLLGTVRPKPYWCAVAVCNEDKVDEQLEELLTPGAVRPILTYQALMGIGRGRLEDRGVCFRQLEGWMRTPEWVENIDLDLIWRTRRLSFGDDFTRTLQSLEAVDRAVADLSEGPAPARSFEAFMQRQVRIAYDPRKGMSWAAGGQDRVVVAVWAAGCLRAGRMSRTYRSENAIQSKESVAMEVSLQDVLALARSEGAVVPNLVGKAFFFRTVTYHIVGRVEEQHGSFVKLGDAAWIADSGRFAQAISEGTLNEVEPVGAAYVNLDSVTEFYPWNHALPLEQK